MAALGIRHAVFVVPTTDLASSLRFYRDALGLPVIEEWDEMGRGALLGVDDGVEIELIELGDVPSTSEPRMGIGLEIADGDVDIVYSRVVANGFSVKGAPRVRPWGKRGFGAIAPEGTPVNVYGPKGKL